MLQQDLRKQQELRKQEALQWKKLTDMAKGIGWFFDRIGSSDDENDED